MERRNTKQRKIVLNAVRSRCDHPSVEQIYNAVHKVDESISLGTVYRNLNILADNHQITRVSYGNADKYDLRVDRHNHFVCEKCGKVTDAEIEYNRHFDGLKTRGGFFITAHQTVYTGICSDCLEKTERKMS